MRNIINVRNLFVLLAALMLAAACADRKPQGGENGAPGTASALPGDSMVYGMACEGCTDSILVFLSEEGGDPDTIDILRATLARRVLGRPRIGDNLAVAFNPDNRQEALCVVNIDRLKGTWAYQVVPTLRRRAVDSAMKDSLPPIPDSIMRKIMVPREYGFTLKRNHAAQPLISGTRDARRNRQSLVQYPRPRFYTEWHLFNGKLILTQESRDSTKESISDTAEILSLRRDTLLLRFAGETKAYYRK